MMKRRALGRTGIQVGEVGIGCEGFLEKSRETVREMLDALLAGGGNCIDLYASNPEMRAAVGEAIRGRREKFVLQGHICSIWDKGQYRRTRQMEEVRAGFEEQLRLLDAGYLDVGMIHYVDSLADWEVCRGEVLAYAKELKDAGCIRAIGLSSHNPEAALAAVESGEIDVLMFSVNPCYDLQPAGEDLEELWAPKNYEKPLLNMDPLRERLYESCQRLGVGITVMKAFGGGDLLHAQYSPAGAALTPYQCIRYALDRPAVASVLAGARTVEEARSAMAYGDAPEAETDYAAALASFPRISWEGHCMYCGHCAPCPAGIDVAAVMKFLSLAKAQGAVLETVREHYGLLHHGASHCIACHACEGRCPFQVPVVEKMAQAVQVFGN